MQFSRHARRRWKANHASQYPIAFHSQRFGARPRRDRARFEAPHIGRFEPVITDLSQPDPPTAHRGVGTTRCAPKPTRTHPGAIEALLRHGDTHRTDFTTFPIHHLYGTAARVPLKDKAFGVQGSLLAGSDTPRWEAAPPRRLGCDVYRALGRLPVPHRSYKAGRADATYGPNADRFPPHLRATPFPRTAL